MVAFLLTSTLICVCWKKTSTVAENQLLKLTYFMIEFVKAQVFFTLSNTIATLKIQFTGGLKPETLNVLSKSYSVLVYYNTMSIALLAMTFVMLIMTKKIPWLLHLIFYLAAFPSLALLADPKMSVENLDHLNTRFIDGPEACGGFKPWVWCLTDDLYDGDPWDVLLIAKFFLSVCVATGTIVNCFSRSCLEEERQLLNDGNHRPRRGDGSQARYYRFLGIKISSNLPSDALHNSYIGFCILGTIPLIFTGLLLNQIRLAGFNTREWDFGQIVAVLIWAAPIAELLNVELRGMKKGLQSRIISPYTVTKHTNLHEDTAHASGIEMQIRGGSSEQDASHRLSDVPVLRDGTVRTSSNT